ncbi:MAG: ATP-dependent DNA ligase [Candidatus Bathyarchaeota archaeon]|nr:MAG: ATP-dependent DNA ligase [Candidatus Bathyarchaeota archaeon]
MKYTIIADIYERIEKTTKRLEMTDHLVQLLKQTSKDRLQEVAYLTQGKLYPDFIGSEMGMAEKMTIVSIAKASGVKKDEVSRLWRKIGDLGTTAEKLLADRAYQPTLCHLPETLMVKDVYETFQKIAHTTGKGSVGKKVNLLTKLLSKATPKEAKYLIRTVTGRLRLGIGDMTFLDALSIAFGGGKNARNVVERAYNMSSDLGLVAKILAEEQLEGIKKVGITVGRPVRPMLCERLTSAKEILEKLGGQGAAEFKYDGLRIQAHITSKQITLFSRRLENITEQFPDIIRALKTTIKAESAIVEGECIAINPDTGEIQPFQIITQRRGRKHHVEEKAREIPVVLILFDALFLNGNALIDSPYTDRRAILENVITQNESVQIASSVLIDNADILDKFMEEAIEAGCEGLVIKALGEGSIYQAGARGFQWIKYKRDYKSEMADTVDLVVVGAFAGRGRRAGTYGALLMAAYNGKKDSFDTICKLGTGFDDKTLFQLPTILSEYSIDRRHPRVTSRLKADYWFVPAKILEVRGAELTLSPTHTCGLNLVKKGVGLAIRFPRFTGKWREDKAPDDATTVNEIASMYKSQLKHS